MVVPLQWAIHTDSTYWCDPLMFKPERFIAEDGSLAKPKAFLPYQAGKLTWGNKNTKLETVSDTEHIVLYGTIGKRMCVGDELAKMMLFLFAARFLHSFVISVPFGMRIDLEGECGITLVPKPHRLTFTPRE